MDYAALGLLGLFLVSFLSATILPLTSEGALLWYLFAGYDPGLCLLVATCGNVLGGTTNYWLGKIGNPEKLRKRIGEPQRFDRLLALSKKHGYWLGLISWVPIIGDPLIIILGYLRCPLLPLLLTMSLSKFLRYLVILWFWYQ